MSLTVPLSLPPSNEVRAGVTPSSIAASMLGHCVFSSCSAAAIVSSMARAHRRIPRSGSSLSRRVRALLRVTSTRPPDRCDPRLAPAHPPPYTPARRVQRQVGRASRQQRDQLELTHRLEALAELARQVAQSKKSRTRSRRFSSRRHLFALHTETSLRAARRCGRGLRVRRSSGQVRLPGRYAGEFLELRLVPRTSRAPATKDLVQLGPQTWSSHPLRLRRRIAWERSHGRVLPTVVYSTLPSLFATRAGGTGGEKRPGTPAGHGHPRGPRGRRGHETREREYRGGGRTPAGCGGRGTKSGAGRVGEPATWPTETTLCTGGAGRAARADIHRAERRTKNVTESLIPTLFPAPHLHSCVIPLALGAHEVTAEAWRIGEEAGRKGFWSVEGGVVAVGRSSSLSVESQNGLGTAVTIRLPMSVLKESFLNSPVWTLGDLGAERGDPVIGFPTHFAADSPICGALLSRVCRAEASF